MAGGKGASIKLTTRRHIFGGGIQTAAPGTAAPSDSLVEGINVSLRRRPALCERPGRHRYGLYMSTPGTLGQKDGKVHYVDGKNWRVYDGQYYDPVYSFDDAAPAAFASFNGESGNVLVCANGVNAPACQFLNVVTRLTSAPLSRVVAAYKGRLFWGDGGDLVYSAAGDIYDYNTPGDAGRLTEPLALTPFTALAEFDDRLVAFTDSTMHLLYGTSPSNFSLAEEEGQGGCVSRRAVTAAGRRLYFIGRDGIYEYGGGAPVRICAPYSGNGVTGDVREQLRRMNGAALDTACAGAIGDAVYFSIPVDGSAQPNRLLVFDLLHRRWVTESGSFIDFERIGGALYGLDTNGWLYDMQRYVTGADSFGAVEWSAIPRPLDPGDGRKLSVRSLRVCYNLAAGGELRVLAAASPLMEDWRQLASLPAAPEGGGPVWADIPLPQGFLQDVTAYRLKFTGKGAFLLHCAEDTVRVRPS